MRRRLESTCRRDRDFPAAIVWTVYYDTPALVSLGEKINSDFLKRKIRVRWYSDLDGVVLGPAFVEAKLRVGTRRLKMRERLPFPAEEVAQWSLQDARLRGLPLLLRDHGVIRHESWMPMMRIRYRRDRFVEPLSHSRVSLDSEIAAVEVNAIAGGHEPYVSEPAAEPWYSQDAAVAAAIATYGPRATDAAAQSVNEEYFENLRSLGYIR